ncbi:MAG TPA: ATP-binding cassette domain-containing protein [Candidatus Saccharimonadales bacterium]|nr:ATP-binding cassette domain-containing protein [Candidatus Saccharimonadales bacterium]
MKTNINPVIKVNHLVKRFDSFIAVNGISFEVNKGEVFAFVGPNGAGKSTTIKMLITLILPTEGEVFIDEHNLIHDADNVRRAIGYVPQMISVDGSLSAYENLELLAKLYDIPKDIRKKRIEEVLTFLELKQVKNSLVKTFSGGMIRKLEIGQAIMHHPHVLFLDEPTQGLDPVARRNVWKHLLKLREQTGMTIFFSTHYMEEAEEVSDRVAIMQKGKLAAIGTIDELKKSTKKQNATLEDAFIYFTGTALQETGNLRDIKRMRQTAGRLG